MKSSFLNKIIPVLIISLLVGGIAWISYAADENSSLYDSAFPAKQTPLQSGNLGDSLNVGSTAGDNSGGCGSIKNFADFVGCVRNGLIQPLIYLLIALAIVYFLSGVLQYVRKGADEDDRRAAVNTIVFGIIAIAVMVSVWGLVNFLTNSFKLDNTTPIVPKISLLK